MRVNLVDPETYARTAKNQRAYARKIADVLARGEPLDALNDPMAGKFAAGILRLWADTLPDTPPKPRGRPPKFPDGAAALDVAAAVMGGMSENKAVEQEAERWDVSVEAIWKAVQKNRDAVKAFLPTKSKPCKKTAE